VVNCNETVVNLQPYLGAIATRIAKQHHAYIYGLSIDDLKQIGSVAALEHYLEFKPSTNIPIERYLGKKAEHAMLDAMSPIVGKSRLRAESYRVIPRFESLDRKFGQPYSEDLRTDSANRDDELTEEALLVCDNSERTVQASEIWRLANQCAGLSETQRKLLELYVHSDVTTIDQMRVSIGYSSWWKASKDWKDAVGKIRELI